jgi:CTP synthase
MGGTMRLGAYPCQIRPGTLAEKIYGTSEISERHRHRYEVNQKYMPQWVEAGLQVAGMSPDGKFVEMVELPGHPWFLGCQFHPEYRSKPFDPHPLFVSYIGAALEHARQRGKPEPATEEAVAAAGEAN